MKQNMKTAELKKLTEACENAAHMMAQGHKRHQAESALKDLVTHESIAKLLAINAELTGALKLAKEALDAIGDEMTVGERYTNAGQYLIDAIEPINTALAKAEGGEL